MIEFMTGLLVGIPIGGFISMVIVWMEVRNYMVIDMTKKNKAKN